MNFSMSIVCYRQTRDKKNRERERERKKKERKRIVM